MAQARNRHHVTVIISKHDKNMYKVIFPLLSLFIFACEGPTANGGPCKYDIDTIAATIIRIDSAGPTHPDIVVTVPSKMNGTDTLRYSANSEGYESPTWETANERGYSVGARLKCVREYRTSGHCTPEIFTVKKELYK